MGLFPRQPKVATNSRKLSEVLRERGYIYQHSSKLEEITDGPKRTLYLGVDPSSDSMHAGQLMGTLVLRRFVEDGHKLIVLLGGGTGMIGDPGGKSDERNLLERGVLEKNTEALRKQLKQLLGGVDFEMVNNADWLGSLNYLEFLRDIGKHFSVNEMIKRDSVRLRLEAPDQGISYTEFSYMLLQAYDFLELHTRHGCDLQVGGSDQWGNIVSGVDLIRRKTGDKVHALCWPLLADKTGKKFGKSEGNAMWLSAEKTTPFDFYQFWFNMADDEVEEFLLKMTLLPKAEIDEVMAAQQADPAARAAQKKLAYEVTTLVHGAQEADKARDFKNMPAVPAGKLREAIKDISTSELRRLIEQGGVSIVDGEKISSIDEQINPGSVIRIGKNKFYQVK
jgi:tyrosyl-tRNA synthetase